MLFPLSSLFVKLFSTLGILSSAFTMGPATSRPSSIRSNQKNIMLPNTTTPTSPTNASLTKAFLWNLPIEILCQIINRLDDVDKICFFLTCYYARELCPPDQSVWVVFGPNRRPSFHKLQRMLPDANCLWEPRPQPAFSRLLSRLVKDVEDDFYICDVCRLLHRAPRPTPDYYTAFHKSTYDFDWLPNRRTKLKVSCGNSGSPWQPRHLDYGGHPDPYGIKVDYHCSRLFPRPALVDYSDSDYDFDSEEIRIAVHRIVRVFIPASLSKSIHDDGESTIYFSDRDDSPFQCCGFILFRQLRGTNRDIPMVDLNCWFSRLGGGAVTYLGTREDWEVIEDDVVRDEKHVIQDRRVHRTPMYECTICGSIFCLTYHDHGPQTGVEIVFDCWNSHCDCAHRDRYKSHPSCWRRSRNKGCIISNAAVAKSQTIQRMGLIFDYSNDLHMPGTSALSDKSFKNVASELGWESSKPWEKE